MDNSPEDSRTAALGRKRTRPHDMSEVVPLPLDQSPETTPKRQKLGSGAGFVSFGEQPDLPNAYDSNDSSATSESSEGENEEINGSNGREEHPPTSAVDSQALERQLSQKGKAARRRQNRKERRAKGRLEQKASGNPASALESGLDIGDSDTELDTTPVERIKQFEKSRAQQLFGQPSPSRTQLDEMAERGDTLAVNSKLPRVPDSMKGKFVQSRQWRQSFFTHLAAYGDEGLTMVWIPETAFPVLLRYATREQANQALVSLKKDPSIAGGATIWWNVQSLSKNFNLSKRKRSRNADISWYAAARSKIVRSCFETGILTLENYEGFKPGARLSETISKVSSPSRAQTDGPGDDEMFVVDGHGDRTLSLPQLLPNQEAPKQQSIGPSKSEMLMVTAQNHAGYSTQTATDNHQGTDTNMDHPITSNRSTHPPSVHDEPNGVACEQSVQAAGVPASVRKYLFELSPFERELQARYWKLTSEDALVRFFASARDMSRRLALSSGGRLIPRPEALAVTLNTKLTVFPGHWGDDCPALPSRKRNATTNDTFSSKSANLFLVAPSQGAWVVPKQGIGRSNPANPNMGISIKGRAEAVAVDSDSDNDPRAFYGKKVERAAPRASIRVATSNYTTRDRREDIHNTKMATDSSIAQNLQRMRILGNGSGSARRGWQPPLPPEPVPPPRRDMRQRGVTAVQQVSRGTAADLPYIETFGLSKTTLWDQVILKQRAYFSTSYEL
ncbi:hypothetical protein B0A49_09041 [Cryomyces minteri]|uniref:Uncharacterized protein n=1 Tax=Cryomyces minteri TaxID=331657 RepID=A0A4U0WAI9_9PEZI|nr:hypothetical protein B0A49_09041 [Cryomyces minteri]